MAIDQLGHSSPAMLEIGKDEEGVAEDGKNNAADQHGLRERHEIGSTAHEPQQTSNVSSDT